MQTCIYFNVLYANLLHVLVVFSNNNKAPLARFQKENVHNRGFELVHLLYQRIIFMHFYEQSIFIMNKLIPFLCFREMPYCAFINEPSH